MDPEIMAEVFAATYFLEAEFADESVQSGTGFCVFNGGMIVTCSHVISRTGNDGQIELPTEITAYCVGPDGNTLAYEVDILKNGNPAGPMDPANMNNPDDLDLAALQITIDGEYPFIMFNGTDPAVNDACFSFGAVYDDNDEVDYQVQQGQVTAVWPNQQGVTAEIRHDCPIVAGFSGGPLTDVNGLVLGVNALEYPNDPRRYAIAAEIVWAFLPDGQ